MGAAYTMSQALGRSTFELRQTVTDAWLNASWPTKQEIPAGRVQQLLCLYTHRAAAGTAAAARILAGAASLMVLLATAAVVQPWVTGFATVVVAFLAILMRPLRTRVKRSTAEASTSALSYSQTVAEAQAMSLEIEVLGVTDQAGMWLGDQARTSVDSIRRSFFAQAAVGPTYQFGAFSLIVLLLTIGASVGVDDVGTIGAVLLLMLRSLSYGQSVQSQRSAFISARVHLDLLDEELRRFRSDLIRLGSGSMTAPNGVTANDLTFSYDGRSHALEGIRFSIEPGEIIGVVGPSGSGKSTLAELILGLRSSAGQLEVDGVLVDDAEREWWSGHVSLVPQQHELLTGTVADNVRFLRPAITDDVVVEACRSAGIHDEILAMSEGYDTHLGERGSKLSGGQRQRVCIARALAGAPRLLVLDEPTSALDTVSERRVLDSIAQLRPQMTVIMVTHRPTCLDICDRVLALNNGRIEHFGKVADLRQDTHEVATQSGTASPAASV
jgi:ABC-type multidrug transport system fused ATPase/permease subunit